MGRPVMTPNGETRDDSKSLNESRLKSTCWLEFVRVKNEAGRILGRISE